MIVRVLTGLAAAALLAGCATTDGGDDGQSPLVGTWRLVELQSSDDAIGTTRPDDPTKYEMTLNADGSVAMQLDCNRGIGRWHSPEPSRIEFGQMAMSMALCPEGSLDSRIG